MYKESNFQPKQNLSYYNGWIVFKKSKSEVFKKFLHVVQKGEKYLFIIISNIRSDNGMELDNNNFDRICKGDNNIQQL